MSPLQRFSSRVPLLLVLAVTTSAVTARASTNRDDVEPVVLACEEAFLRLARCCAGVDFTNVTCIDETRIDEGCTTRTTTNEDPTLTRAESDCIRETSCEALVASGVCLRAARAPRRVSSYTETTSSSSSSSGSWATPPSSPTPSTTSNVGSAEWASRGPVCP